MVFDGNMIASIDMGKKITALKAQKRNHQRVSVYLDGEYAFGLSRFVAAWLHVGQELSDEKIEELQIQDDQEIAYQKAIRLVGYRMRSESEIKRYLQNQDISPETIEEVSERLKRSGLVDDLRFAQIWVENRNEFRPRSHRMLSIELQRKGIPQEIISQITDEIPANDVLAYEAANRQVRKYRHLEWEDFRRKLTSFLARRGFSYETIKPIVSQVWAELKPDDQIELTNN
jgi:regulatory protein